MDLAVTSVRAARDWENKTMLNVTKIVCSALCLSALSLGCSEKDRVPAVNHSVREALIPDLESPEPETEPIANIVRGFDCTPDAVGDGQVIATLDSGASLRIAPVPEFPCQYHLFYVNGADQQQLTTTPGGYLFALGWQSEAGDLALCASNIHHQTVEGTLHEISDVTLECAFRVQGLWTALVPVVQPKGQWAAWPRSLGLAEGDTNSLTLDFVRDSTFNILNMTDGGRPEDDGIYTITFTLESDGFQVSEPMRMTSERTNPFISKRWEPTEDEKTEFSGVIDFDDGACPQGCDDPEMALPPAP